MKIAEIIILFFLFITSCACRSLSDKEDFVPCQNEDDLETLWPDYSDSSVFYKCVKIREWKKFSCPETLLFRFDYQECVLKKDWKSPPSQKFIKSLPIFFSNQNDKELAEESSELINDSSAGYQKASKLVIIYKN